MSEKKLPAEIVKKPVDDPSKLTAVTLSKQLDRERAKHEQDLLRKDKTIRRLEREISEFCSETGVKKQQVMNNVQDADVAKDKLEQEVTQLTERLRTMAAKLERVPGLERLVVDVYMEFRPSPHGDLDPNSQEFQKAVISEREALKAQSPCVTLDYLRNYLRKWSLAVVDREVELSRMITNLNAEKLYLEVTLRERAKELAEEKENAAKNASAALAAAEKVKHERSELISKHRAEVDDLKLNLDNITHKAAHKDKVILALEENVTQLEQQVQQKEGRLTKVTQLEQQLSTEQRTHRLETNNLKVQSLQQRLQLEKESAVFFKAQSEKTELMQSIKDLKTKLHESKVAISRSRIIETEQEASYNAEQLKLQLIKTNELTRQLNKAIGEKEELLRQNAEMKVEYTKVFAAMQRHQELQQISTDKFIGDNSRSRFVGTESALNVATLKSRLSEKEKECQILQRRAKKLILGSHREQKYFEQERDMLLEDINTVQKMAETVTGEPLHRIVTATDRKLLSIKVKHPSASSSPSRQRSSSPSLSSSATGGKFGVRPNGNNKNSSIGNNSGSFNHSSDNNNSSSSSSSFRPSSAMPALVVR